MPPLYGEGTARDGPDQPDCKPRGADDGGQRARAIACQKTARRHRLVQTRHQRILLRPKAVLNEKGRSDEPLRPSLSSRNRASVRARLWHPRKPLHFQLEHPRRVQTQDLRAFVVAQMSHLALDRLRGMGPRTFMMRIVVRPHEVPAQIVLPREVEPRRILLERREPVRAKILA